MNEAETLHETEIANDTEAEAANDASNGPIPLQPVPAQAVPVQAVPVQAVPVQAVPVQEAAAEDVSYEGTVIQGTADEGTADEETVFEGTVIEGTADEETADEVAGGVALDDAAPVDVRPVADAGTGPLLADTEELRSDWQRIKGGFVDNPRTSVAQAETVVDEAIDRLVAALRARQDRTRDSWDRDGRDTESLRQALLTYQGLFNRVTAL
jgi:hypothetical protein